MTQTMNFPVWSIVAMILYPILCVAVGVVGKRRGAGFAIPFLVSFFASPIIGLPISIWLKRR